MAPIGEVIPDTTVCYAANYPRIAKRDVIIENENLRYYVERVDPVKLLRATTKQILQLTLVKRNDPVYELPASSLAEVGWPKPLIPFTNYQSQSYGSVSGDS